MNPSPKRIVVRQVNWLGDVVMSQPALRALRAAYPDARLAILIRAELASFFAGAAWVDEVIGYRIRPGWRGVGDQVRLVTRLRRDGYDLGVLFPDSFQSALWFAAAGIPRRVGYARDARRPLLTAGVARRRGALQGHQVHYRLQLLREALGIEGTTDDFAIDVDAGRRTAMESWLSARRRRAGGALVALAAGAAYGPAKQWPIEHFAALVDRLADERGAECVVVGSPGERAMAEQVAAAARHGAIVAAGETDVGSLVALLSLCSAFVGNDSGAMHVAGALGLPTIGIFGSTRPGRTAPLGPRARVVYHGIDCSPCLDRTCRFGHYRCLRDVAPGEVAAALDAAMSS